MVIEILSSVSIVGTGLFLAWSFNRVARLAQRCDQALADVDVQLRHRHDLIPGLVEAVRGFATHEHATLDKLLAVRTTAMTAAQTTDRMSAEADISARLKEMMATASINHHLYSSRHFSDLRRELADAENKIAAARRFFNAAVSEHNATLTQFPANLWAGRRGLHPRRYFDLGIERVLVQDAPTIKF